MTPSEIVSRIKPRGNESTELAFMRRLREAGIKGWRRHAKVLGVRPDFVFRRLKVALFVDGCFWHGCRRHCGLARLSPYWRRKIIGNMIRDVRQWTLLTDGGWKVFRVWEHDLKGAGAC